MVKRILSNNLIEVEISEEDLDLLSITWSPDKDGYLKGRNNKKEYVKLHKLIAKRMGLNGEVDHKDRNKLNNKRENIRQSSHSQNCMNQSKRGLLKYKGVYFNGSKYRARITVNKQLIYKDFNSEIEAAKEYDRLATKYFGEFACTNQKLGLL